MKIKTITLEVKDHLKVELSLEEARELYEELCNLFSYKASPYLQWPYIRPYIETSADAASSISLTYKKDDK